MTAFWFRRYQNSTTIPNYVNSQNLSGDDLELATQQYYCHNTAQGTLSQGLIPTYSKLKSLLSDFKNFIQLYNGPPNLRVFLNTLYAWDT